ncbi:hypothetical protein B5E77_10150 [Lachnoclostridium sp. An131]|uniref:FtsK/SpoIIIE domain-containing protein n=1 Tax=Lachnoclostridium sp. An131 TaxID=1965555 RepID=UPI000B3A790B|nr:FtsK/SpoIIIE domain-containing protein [Lachnoclostridium sp. An131]OUQ25831.1 hypothetical protein B5E77_10150 [Lachnoclostridium sp. An131]
MAASLMEHYKQIFAKAEEKISRIREIETEISGIGETDTELSRRIERLSGQIEKIEEYLLKIRGFQELAKKNLSSQNVLTIEAPENYRVNLNRLRNWAMMIDPASGNDPYAQRVFVVAKCDECFLMKKKKEFTERIEKLREQQTSDAGIRMGSLEKELSELQSELDEYGKSEELREFLDEVKNANRQYWYKESPQEFLAQKETKDFISPGAYLARFDLHTDCQEFFKGRLEEFYDISGKRILLPVEIPADEEFVMTIQCAPTRDRYLDRGLQNLMLNLINSSAAGKQKIYVLDAVRYNASSLGSLKQLENSFALAQIPRNPELLTQALEDIVFSFADIDEKLGEYDSVREYNDAVSSSQPEHALPLTTLIVYGWPRAYTGKNRELLLRIMTNYERYGVSFIVVSYQKRGEEGKSEQYELPEYATHKAIDIQISASRTVICFADSQPLPFTWYVFNDDLSSGFVDSYRKHKIEKQEIGNEYTKRYSLTELPPYTREYKKIELPFGIDSKDKAHFVSFENENFAAYLVGASRSGKSTLLHTLIAGLIRNYHPDNVELWLADFKQLEFKRYMTHLPPHVKYILLDESTELVYDLIDKLTEKMMERQQLFSRLGKQRLDQIDPKTLDKPLPVIFVILDEFSIMSQSIAESPIYKLRLQNILAKGAALGIKFLFSSQTFTTGVAGLTSTARAQIQQRIAMKGTKEEISETLELSASLKTEQVRNWIDALPPHYALVKFRSGADKPPQVKRFLVMYFEDYAPRDEMIQRISQSMHAVAGYDPSDINSYTDKHPVLVDGNSYNAFYSAEFLSDVKSEKKMGGNDLDGDEVFVSFGTPRLMVKNKFAVLSSETRENLLLIARTAEQQCAASVLLSSIKSFLLQKGRVQIWAYGKNRLYKAYKNVFAENDIHIFEDIDAVCDAIRELKKNISDRKQSNELIVMIGMERICIDFDFAEGNNTAFEGKKSLSITEVRKSFEEKGAVVSTKEEELKQQYAQAWVMKRIKLKREAKASGKTEEEIKIYLSEAEKKFREEYGIDKILQESIHISDSAEEQKESNKENESGKSSVSGAYNAQEDFVYVVKQGSRLGYHFMMNLTDLSDLKQCGLKADYFRYRMAFQMSAEDSRNLFGNKIASLLPIHICQFDDTIEKFSFRPYLHKGIGWDGWYIDEKGIVVSPYTEN